jgi:hypothetical protein
MHSITTAYIRHGLRRATRPKFERCWLSAGAVAFSAGGDGVVNPHETGVIGDGLVLGRAAASVRSSCPARKRRGRRNLRRTPPPWPFRHRFTPSATCAAIFATSRPFCQPRRPKFEATAGITGRPRGTETETLGDRRSFAALKLEDQKRHESSLPQRGNS